MIRVRVGITTALRFGIGVAVRVAQVPRFRVGFTQSSRVVRVAVVITTR